MMSADVYHNGSGCNDTALQVLIESLEQVHQKVDTPVEDHLFLSQLLQNKNLQSLITVHDKIICPSVQPIHQDLHGLANDVKNLLYLSSSAEANELEKIIENPNLQALFLAHDLVARKDFVPTLPDVPFEVEDDDKSVKVVQLIKNTEPLGATIKIDEVSDAVIVSRIVRGSVADRSGLINVGDELKEVNGIPVKGKSPLDILDVLEQCRGGTITFKLVPGTFPIKYAPSSQVRANFNYDPFLDSLNPRPGYGLAYKRGDILHIVSRQDSDWWQAHHETDSTVGIIPSSLLQKRRLSTFHNGVPDSDSDEMLVYEDVTLLHPVLKNYRPIVLIGAPGVGRNELKQRLISYDSDHYKTTIPHTSRPPKHWEEEGKEYYFVSREVMEQGIHNARFVEYGEYKGNLYGTSLESVLSIVRSGSVCILNPHPQALKFLRTAVVKPYIIFIKPPPFDVLKETRTTALSSFDEFYTRSFTDQELQEVLDNSADIEEMYGHKFDCELVNDDLSRAYNELLLIIKDVENKPQWAPSSWMLGSS